MKVFMRTTSVCLFFLASLPVTAAETVQAYELLYDEQEAGTDIYRNRYLVTDNYIRIDEPGDGAEEGGFILFDNGQHTIYSVSNFNQSVLVIKAEPYSSPDMQDKVSIEYSLLSEAPKIDGHPVYNYRVVSAGAEHESCMDIQLAQGLLPDISKMFSAYQKVVASQQHKLLPATPLEYQTSCFLYDQVYNEGLYYDKGLPIQEWHSNGKKKLLSAYKSIKVDLSLFDIPAEYRQYSVD